MLVKYHQFQHPQAPRFTQGSSKEYRKRNASGAVCDDPRIAVGPGVLTEL